MLEKNIIKTAINYAGLTLEKSKDFNSYKYINICESNPLQISYIKQDKIEGLKEHQNINFVNSKEQKKYLDNTTIIKLLNNMFKAKSVEEVKTINEIGEKVHSLLKLDSIQDLQLFFYDDVPRFYNQQDCELKTLKNGSCMEGKPSEFFEIYNKFINVKTQIVGLRKGNSVLARAILWTKTEKQMTQFGNDTEAVEVEIKKYYLDRIYVATQYDNDLKELLQARLWAKTKRALRIKTLNCYSSFNIKNHYKGEPKLTKDVTINKSYADFDIQISKNSMNNLEKFPYIDNFRYFKEMQENYKSCGDGEHEIAFDLTDGYYTDNENNCECAHTGSYYHIDDCAWSECEDCYYHLDYAQWIEERQDYVDIDNAIYNEFTGDYHWKEDLDY